MSLKVVSRNNTRHLDDHNKTYTLNYVLLIIKLKTRGIEQMVYTWDRSVVVEEEAQFELSLETVVTPNIVVKEAIITGEEGMVVQKMKNGDIARTYKDIVLRLTCPVFNPNNLDNPEELIREQIALSNTDITLSLAWKIDKWASIHFNTGVSAYIVSNGGGLMCDFGKKDGRRANLPSQIHLEKNNKYDWNYELFEIQNQSNTIISGADTFKFVINSDQMTPDFE